MMTRAMRKKQAELEKQTSAKRKPDKELETATNKLITPKKAKRAKPEKAKSTPKPQGLRFEAAIRPRKREGTLYLRDLQIVHVSTPDQKPARAVECVNFHKEDIFGHGGEDLNMGFPNCGSIYLLPIWTSDITQAQVTGFELVATQIEDPTGQNLYSGNHGWFVYLRPTFDPTIEERIIGVQLYRSRRFNPPKFGWSHSTGNINEGRGGDNLYFQWDLGTEQDVPGHRYRFRFWRR